MRGTPSIWDVITEQVIAMNGRSYSEVVAMVSDILSRAGISSVGGCSAALLSQASAVVIGAVGTHLAATLLIASYVNLLTTSEIAYAVNSSKNFLNIRYLTSYHGRGIRIRQEMPDGSETGYMFRPVFMEPAPSQLIR